MHRRKVLQEKKYTPVVMSMHIDIIFYRVIEFKDKDAARKAIETMHQYKIHDRYLVVNEVRLADL